MNMDAERQYLKVVQERYFMTKSRKDKSSILDEYSRNTHQNRKYVIRRIHSFSSAPGLDSNHQSHIRKPANIYRLKSS